MPKQQSKVEQTEDMVNLIYPPTGEVIPTVRWVAEDLIKQGWKVAENSETKIEEK
jgi:hypothetical protein